MAMASKRTPTRPDNFKLVKGINRSIERRLHQAGILTYTQLASLKPSDISTLLGELNGVTAKRIAKENWSEQARVLSSRPDLPESNDDAAADEAPPSIKSGGLTSFVVEFLRNEAGQTKRTKVMHVDTGNEDTWIGWQERRLLDFFITRAGLSSLAAEAVLPTASRNGHTHEAGPPLPTASAAERDAASQIPSVQSPMEPHPKSIAIATSTGRLSYPESMPTPFQSRSASAVISSNQPFDVHLALELTETDYSKRRPLSYKAAIFAKNLTARLRQAVGEADGLLEPTDMPVIKISGNPLPQGLYRLQAVVGFSDPTSQTKPPSASTVQTGEKLLHVA
jgi:hypothetical protein